MRQFLFSSARFIWRVTKRGYAGVVLWLLDVSDIWTRYLQPLLEQRGIYLSPTAIWLVSVLVPWIIGATIIAAILYTFYEVDRQVIRPPKIGKQLKRFYEESGEMLRREIKSDADVAKLKADYDAWGLRIIEWVGKNMELASMNRLAHFQPGFPFKHPAPFNDEHQMTINGISTYHQNLHALIDSQEWR
jgi:hypothetical protein